MTEPRTDARRALAQYLRTDRYFRVRVVPIAPATVEAMGKPTASETGARDSAAAEPQDPAAPLTVRKLPQKPADPEVLRQKHAALDALNAEQVRDCTRCGLSRTRNKTVFGQGHADARLVFVGEAPGADEDRQGLAFVGRAGQLLTRMVEAMGLSRDDVFICNVLKCRPPENRNPAPDEIAACSPYLMEQLTTIGPEVIVALGAPAAQTLLQTKQSIGRLRGRFHEFYPSGSPMIGDAVPLMPTYHPAYLLRSPGEKAKAWQDLQQVMELLGLPLPKRTG
jgi:DNA polymerase